jgi:hypothetical protein
VDKVEVKLADLDTLLEKLDAIRPRERKLFGTYHDFALLSFGFLLTGIFGTVLTYLFDANAKKKEQANIVATAQLQSASDLFKDLSRSTSQRLRSMISFAHEYYLPAPEPAPTLDDRWENYEKVLGEWNTRRDYRRAMVRNLYGQVVYQKERNIHYAFLELGKKLESVRKKSFSSDSIESAHIVEQELTNLGCRIQNYYFRMAADLNRGTIGKHRRMKNAETSTWQHWDWNHPDTLTGYLDPCHCK